MVTRSLFINVKGVNMVRFTVKRFETKNMVGKTTSPFKWLHANCVMHGLMKYWSSIYMIFWRLPITLMTPIETVLLNWINGSSLEGLLGYTG
jgi:hypothetical protein